MQKLHIILMQRHNFYESPHIGGWPSHHMTGSEFKQNLIYYLKMLLFFSSRHTKLKISLSLNTTACFSYVLGYRKWNYVIQISYRSWDWHWMPKKTQDNGKQKDLQNLPAQHIINWTKGKEKLTFGHWLLMMLVMMHSAEKHSYLCYRFMQHSVKGEVKHSPTTSYGNVRPSAESDTRCLARRGIVLPNKDDGGVHKNPKTWSRNPWRSPIDLWDRCMKEN